MEEEQGYPNLTFERKFYMKMVGLTRLVRRKLVLLFDLPIDALLTQVNTHARDTGFGISAPNAYQIVDVVRHDWAMVLTFLCIMTFISRILYLIIQPESIFDLEYSLAILFLFYTIGILVITYQAIRDMDYPNNVDMLLPEIHPAKEICAICREELPIQDMLSLHCYTPEGGQPVKHRFCELCITETWRARRAQGLRRSFECPICRQIPLGYDRHYGPPVPGVLDNSHFMWYINSLFTRRLLLMHRFIIRRPYYILEGDPRNFNTRYYVQLLPCVLLNHFFCLMALLFYCRALNFTYLPFGFLPWIVVVSVTIASLNKIGKVLSDRYTALVRDNPDFGVAMVVKNFAAFVNFIIDPDQRDLRDGQDHRDEGRDDGEIEEDDEFDDEFDEGESEEGDQGDQGDQGEQNQEELQQVRREFQQVQEEFQQVQQQHQEFQRRVQQAREFQQRLRQDGELRQGRQGLPVAFLVGFRRGFHIACAFLRTWFMFGVKLFFRVGCFSLFDIIKYAGLNISIFALMIALHQLVMLFFFELENSLVVPSYHRE